MKKKFKKFNFFWIFMKLIKNNDRMIKYGIKKMKNLV